MSYPLDDGGAHPLARGRSDKASEADMLGLCRRMLGQPPERLSPTVVTEAARRNGLIEPLPKAGVPQYVLTPLGRDWVERNEDVKLRPCAIEGGRFFVEKDMKPSIGRVVHLDGRAAVITDVNADGTVDLSVLPTTHKGVPFSDADSASLGVAYWPPRV